MKLNMKHGPDCWKIHHTCAVAEIYRLRELLDSNTFRVSRKHPATSKAIEPKIAKSDYQVQVVNLIRGEGERGLTDKEGEALTGRTHESYSGCRRTLVLKGLIKDSGRKRRTPSGNWAIVWVAA